MSKLTHYLLPLLIAGSLFLSSCSDPPPQPAEPVSFPTLQIAPSAGLSIESSCRLARQVQLLTNNSKIVKISNTKSMIPILDSNSLAVVEQIFIFNSLKVGDIIVYQNNEKNSILYNLLIIHRIYNIDYEKQIIIAKGDNCQEPDTDQITPDQIQGRVFCIIYSAEEIK